MKQYFLFPLPLLLLFSFSSFTNRTEHKDGKFLSLLLTPVLYYPVLYCTAFAIPSFLLSYFDLTIATTTTPPPPPPPPLPKCIDQNLNANGEEKKRWMELDA